MKESETQVVRREDMKRSSKRPLPCEVCGDRASGYHYGAHTCEACKRFFRLTNVKKRKLDCLNNFTCEVNKETRKQCRACRFRACLNAGMRFPDLEHDGLDDDVPPKKKNTKISAGMDLINILLEAHGTTSFTHTDLSCKETLSGFQDMDEFGENGRTWAAHFVSRVLDSCGEQLERRQANQEMAVLDIMTLRLAARFMPELKGFLFQSRSLVTISDIAKRLGRKLCRRLLYMASLLIFMGVDDHEVLLLCGILATLTRPSQYEGEASPSLDDILRSHIKALHQYELNKRSWMSNISYKMLQALFNVHEISIKEDGGLFVWSFSQEDETFKNKTGFDRTPSPEAASILAMELLQGLVSIQSPSQCVTVHERTPSPECESYLNPETFFNPLQNVISLDFSHMSGFSNSGMHDKHFDYFHNSSQNDCITSIPNNLHSDHYNYLSHHQLGLGRELPGVGVETDNSSHCQNADNCSTCIHACLPPDLQYFSPNILYNKIYSSYKQRLSKLEHPPPKNCISEIQYLGSSKSNASTKNAADSKISFTSFMIGQHPALLLDI